MKYRQLGGVMSLMSCVTGSRPQSTRRHAWRVQPVSASTGNPAYNSTGSRQTVLCGYLFNADAERRALGQGVGEGEECCITLEPIADARLEFSDTIRVSCFSPMLTGVELLCGHRFSASNLLWHWCMSPMVCPMCRAPYLLHCGTIGSTPRTDVVPGCSAVDNFPSSYWRLLRGIMEEHTRERTRALEQEDQSAIVDAVMTDVLENVLETAPTFFLMVSFVGTGLHSTHHSIRLRHMITPGEATDDENLLRLAVPRAATRYLSRVLNAVDRGTPVSEHYSHMTAAVLVEVGTTSTGVTIMLPVTEFPDHPLPICQSEDVGVITSEAVRDVAWYVPVVDELPGTGSVIDPEQLSVPMEGVNEEHVSSVNESSVVDVVPMPPGQTIVSMVSHDSNSAMHLEFFKDIRHTLVGIEVSLSLSSIIVR